jgi:heme/copper-type cytochrome/quinol oxidase subunit 3
MADVSVIETSPPALPGRIHSAPLTPGKVAMWLFLATEVMFFTGLIGSYIVLRAGSPPAAYSNLFPPGSDLTHRLDARGIVLDEVGTRPEEVAKLAARSLGLTPAEAAHRVESGHPVVGVTSSYEPADLDALAAEFKAAGATPRIVGLETYPWPRPYDNLTNPLSIDLTALNTFILICSSVTMVLALAAIQRGDRAGLSRWLLATVLIGSTFLGIQVFEYYQLMVGHQYPPGVSASGHFRPDVSLFASTFFAMTGFHGAHVTGGVVVLAILWLRSLFGGFSAQNHAAIEMAGLYWHFVDLVWILLFTVVYLV